jgi:hypothetical protein
LLGDADVGRTRPAADGFTRNERHEYEDGSAANEPNDVPLCGVSGDRRMSRSDRRATIIAEFRAW